EREARRPRLLLHLAVDLLVIGDEEERLVPLERPAQREAELVLVEVGLEALHRAAREAMLRRAGDSVELPEVVERAVEQVGAGLGDHVHESRAGAAELGRRSAGGDHDLLHRIEVEREGRPLAAALLAEEGVVEVGAVHRHVVVDPLLPRDRQLVAVGPLHDRYVGREQGQIEKVAAVVRETGDRLVGQPGRCFHLRHVHQRRRRQGQRGELDRLELQGEVHRHAHPQDDAGLLSLAEAHGTGGDVVRAQRQQRCDEHANPFRVRAYRNAARTIRDFPEPIAELVRVGTRDLTDIPGIGEDLAEKITEIVTTGELPLRKQLAAKLPAGLLDLLRIPGLGPKRVKLLHKKLKVKSAADLAVALDQGRVQKLKGFGPKIEEKMRAGLGAAQQGERRMLLHEAETQANAIVGYLQAGGGIAEIAVAGSYRRRRETIGDLDILVTSGSSPQVMDRFAEYGEVAEVVSKGDTRAT